MPTKSRTPAHGLSATFLLAGLLSLFLSYSAAASVETATEAQAKTTFDAAIAVNKRDVSAYLKLAKVYLEAENYNAADKLIKSGVKKVRKKSGKLDLWALAIESKLKQGEIKTAKKYLASAETNYKTKRHSTFMIAKAKVLINKERFEDAENLLVKLIPHVTNKAVSVEIEQVRGFVVDAELATKFSQTSLRFKAVLARADLAKLLVSEFNLDSFVEKSGSKVKSTTDVSEEQQKNIDSVLAMNLRGLKVSAGLFQPKHRVTRAELAMAMEDILAKTQGVSRTRFIGSESPFTDMASNHTAFNAMMNMVSRAYMKADSRGVIDPNGLVTGPEAIIVLARIKRSISQPPSE